MRVVLELANRESQPELERFIERNRQAHEPWVFHGSTPQYFERVDEGRAVGLFVRLRDSGELVGVVNINNPIEGNFRSAFLGYFQDTDHAGKGLMSEALGLAMEYAFFEMGLHRLEANIQPENDRSIALVKRLGFRLEGFSPQYLCIGDVWRDHQRWAILDTEWIDGKARQALGLAVQEGS